MVGTSHGCAWTEKASSFGLTATMTKYQTKPHTGIGKLARIRIKGVSCYTDRHGNTHWRFRSKGFQCALPSPDSPGFSAALERARQHMRQPAESPKRAPRGTFDWLIAAYYRSADFHALKASTQAVYRGVLEPFRAKHGFGPVGEMKARHIRAIMDGMIDRPHAANRLLKLLRQLMRLAILEELRADDPTIGIRPFSSKSDGFKPWSWEQIDAFRNHHPHGSKPRLALELLLNTGARRGDVVLLGRQNMTPDGKLHYVQSKTGTPATPPILPELQAEIDALPKGQMLFLVTEHGRPHSVKAFGNWFRKQCKAAGIPKGYSAHGLRKACAIRLADARCTTHEIMAITGHKTLSEVQRYTSGADRVRAAESATAKLTSKSTRRTKNG